MKKAETMMKRRPFDRPVTSHSIAAHHKIEGVRLTVIEENTFAKLLYEKPIAQRGDSLFKRIKKWFEEKDYRATEINPMIKKLRNTAPSFLTLCEFADFIKIIEKVFFYYNDIMTNNSVNSNPVTKIYADQKYDSTDKKVLIIDMPKERVTAKLTMTRRMNEEAEGIVFDDIVEGYMQYQFGKDLTLNFRIVNGEMDFKSVHDYNLMYNLNLVLQDVMADLFEEYYNLV